MRFKIAIRWKTITAAAAALLLVSTCITFENNNNGLSSGGIIVVEARNDYWRLLGRRKIKNSNNINEDDNEMEQEAKHGNSELLTQLKRRNGRLNGRYQDLIDVKDNKDD